MIESPLMKETRDKSICPVCQRELLADDDCLLCSECGARHHRPCWHRNEACGINDCASVTPVEEAIIEEMAAQLDTPQRNQYFRHALLFISIVALTAFIAVKFLFRGQEIAVPNLIGVHLNDARRTLQAKGLKLKISDKQYDNFIPEDNIIAQRPQPGSHVKKGRMLRVTASLGSKIIKVPDFTGQDMRMTNLLLLQNGLKLGSVCQVHSPDHPRNQVIGQDPEQGSQIARAGTISFLVAQGPPNEYYLMPDLTYQSFTEHLNDFTSDLFHLDKIRDEAQDDLPVFTIIKQRPLAGTRISHGEKMDITLSHHSSSTARYRLLKLQVPSGPKSKRVRIELKDHQGNRVVADEDRPAGSFLKLPLLVNGRGTVKIYINGRLTMEREI